MNTPEPHATDMSTPYPEEPVTVRAPFDTRILAGFVDFLIVVFLGFLFSRFDSRSVIWAMEFVAIVVYRRVFGATPGQQLVGMREERNPVLGRTIVTSKSRRTLWLRGILAASLVVYVGLTFCVGAMFSRLTDEKIDRRRVSTLPIDIARPVSDLDGVRREFDRVTLLLPRTLGTYSAEEISCCTIYGGESSDDRLEPGIVIAALSDLHPYDYCGGVRNRAAAWLAGCEATPLEYQRSIEGITPQSRRWILGPVGVVRTNFKLIAKNLYFEEMISEQGLRRFRSGNAEVLWMRGKRTIKKKKENVDVAIDRFVLADDKSFGALDIIWRKVPRDERIARFVASTIALRDVVTDTAAQELRAAATGDERVHLTNAFRIDRKNLEIAARLRDALAREGTVREKRSFARGVIDEAQNSEHMRSLAQSVAEWK